MSRSGPVSMLSTPFQPLPPNPGTNPTWGGTLPPRVALAGLLLLAASRGSTSGAEGSAQPVSPGEVDRTVEIATSCPTFTWAAGDGAAGYELAVLDLGRAEEPLVAFRRTISGAATAWTPARADCLKAGGTYAWTLRALDAAGQPPDGEASWPALRHFSLPATPSAEEVATALDTLRRWQAAETPTVAPGTASAPSHDSPSPRVADRLVEAAGTAAVRGENPAGTGASFGVLGQSSSAAGAGLVAINLAAGPDLLLDGAAQGEVDTSLTQSGVDRPSASAQTFDVRNSGGGGMALRVDGTSVSLLGHTHSGGEIVSGIVAESHIASTLARDSEVMTLVLAGDGSGSTLDADRLDGQEPGSTGSINSASNPVHWTKLKGVPATLADGEDSTIPPRKPFRSIAIDAAGDVGEFASVTIGADGLPIVSYYDRTNGDLKVAHCETIDCAEATVTTLDATGDVGQYTSIGIVGDLPVIAYFDVTNLDLKLARCDDAACTSAELSVLDAVGDVGRFASLIAANSLGGPSVAYFDNSNGDLRFLRCRNAICSATDRTTVDAEGLVGYFASLAAAPDGDPVISYWDLSENQLKLALCSNVTCSSKSLVVLDASGNAGSHGSLTVSSDGLPLVVYRDASVSYLKAAHCNTYDCSSVTLTPLVSDGGFYTAVTVGEDGLPIITHHHSGAGILGVAHCADPACTKSRSAQGPYLSTDFGEYTSVAIGVDGFPFLVHHDEANGDLIVQHCSDRFCTPGLRRR